jgi:tripartite ATP-independent transporter DctP family solute receptor
MKKVFSFVSVLVAVSILFIGTASAATVIKIANPLPTDNPSSNALRYFGALVNEESKGEIDVQVFDNSTLGTATENFEMVQLGTLEMVFISAGPASQFIPEWEIFSLPYIFQSRDHMLKALYGEFGKAMEDFANQQKIVFLGWFDSGDRNLFTARKAVSSPTDLRGLKIRVMDSKMMVDSLNAMGALATPMGMGEVYSALQQNVIDGWENNLPSLLSLKTYEVSPYVSWTRHFMTPDALVISAGTFNKLSPKNQAIIREAAQKACQKQFTDWAAYMEIVVKELEKVGCKFTEIKDLTPFAESVDSVKEAYKKQYGTKFLDMINEIQ